MKKFILSFLVLVFLSSSTAFAELICVNPLSTGSIELCQDTQRSQMPEPFFSELLQSLDDQNFTKNGYPVADYVVEYCNSTIGFCQVLAEVRGADTGTFLVIQLNYANSQAPGSLYSFDFSAIGQLPYAN